MKKTIILAITICMAINTFAERRSIKDHTDNWLQGENTQTGGSLRGGGYDEEDGRPGIDDDNTTNPANPSLAVGGGITCLLLLASGYGLTRKKR
ncbi:MAG: hypothetical protein LBS25_07160 [Candidatus Symbiothrix sp.]|jgi:hypothetical protein|nr:hypothetical protein [Candidatus Symbiothrix sp.]